MVLSQNFLLKSREIHGDVSLIQFKYQNKLVFKWRTIQIFFFDKRKFANKINGHSADKRGIICERVTSLKFAKRVNIK